MPEEDKRNWKANAQRNAWRTFKRMGIGWKIPLSEFIYDTGEGEQLVIPYISPQAYLKYFLHNCPDLLVGGCSSTQDCCTQLHGFWAAYKQSHKTHVAFQHFEQNELPYVLPLAVHGDEGRGKRRTGTMVVSLESPLGVPTCKTVSKKRKQCSCDPPQSERLKYNRDVAPVGSDLLRKTIKSMVTNTKNHSFLQRWPLVVIPGVIYKAFPGIVESFHKLLAQELRDLFYSGVAGPAGRVYNGVLIGLKGDMKWHTRIGCLSRSYEHQGRVRDIQCCHFCLGGGPNLPWEDLRENPCWTNTIFSTRPWTDDAQLPLLCIPFDTQAPEALYRTDPFHMAKVGVFRDMVGSSIFWFIRHHYYGRFGQIPAKLSAAFGCFKLFCHTQNVTPSLRSFTQALFMYKSAKSFPYTNTKGSDTILLMRFVVLQAAAFSNDLLQDEDLPTLQLIHNTALSGLDFFDTLYAHGLFLTRDCAISLYLHGNDFIGGFCRLASFCLNKFNLYAIKPKLHMFRHCLLEIKGALLEGAEFIINPLVWNCEGNEDSIGRLSTLSRRLDSRNISAKILMCYLVKAQILYQRLRKSGHSRLEVRTFAKRKAAKNQRSGSRGGSCTSYHGIKGLNQEIGSSNAMLNCREVDS